MADQATLENGAGTRRTAAQGVRENAAEFMHDIVELCELQASLAEREEEVSGLRADVAFYERLVGATGQRRGLSVHEAVFAPEEGGTWRYTVTLTQNLNRGAISKGEARISVEGVSSGRLRSLPWETLVQKPGAPGQPFSFRYFQQLEGSVMLWIHSRAERKAHLR